jgi:hypothetical protein
MKVARFFACVVTRTNFNLTIYRPITSVDSRVPRFARMTAYRSRLPDKLLRVVRSHNDPVSERWACPEAAFQEQRVRRKYRQIEVGQENMTPVLNDEVYLQSVWTAVTTCFEYMR